MPSDAIGPPSIRARVLIPALLVAVLAVTASDRDPCRPTDGPQFRCWLLREHRP